MHFFQNSAIFLLLAVFYTTEVHAVPVLDTPSAQTHPEGKQGILEIPKQVATILRNVIDRNLQAYLNLTTPKPNPNNPDNVVENSIIGHYLLNNFIISPVPAMPYKPPSAAEPKPIFTSDSATYSKDPNINKVSTEQKPLFTTDEISFSKNPPTQKPTSPKPIFSTDSVSYEKKPVDAVAATSGQVKPVTQPPAVPAKATTAKAPLFPDLYDSYGVLVNTSDSDEVYFVNPNRESVVFPLESSTQKPKPVETTVDPEAQTEEAVTPTKEDGDEDEDVNVNEEFQEFKRRQENVDIVIG